MGHPQDHGPNPVTCRAALCSHTLMYSHAQVLCLPMCVHTVELCIHKKP